MRSFFVHYSEVVSYLIYAIIFAVRWFLLRRRSDAVLLFFYGNSACILLTGIIFNDDNDWTYNLVFLETIICLSWFFYQQYNAYKRRRALLVILTINLLLYAYYIGIHQLVHSYNSYLFAVTFISVVLYGLLYFRQLFENIEDDDILDNFTFWLVSSYLIHYFGAFCIILFYNKATNTDLRGNLWGMHNIILFASAVIASIGHARTIKKST